MPWNESGYQFISSFSNKVIFWDDLAVFLAQYLVYFVLVGLVPFFISLPNSKERWLLFFKIALAVVISRGILTETFHYFWTSLRPQEFYGLSEPLVVEKGNSFPSGHMMTIWPVVLIFWSYSKGWGLAYAFLGAAIGLARIYTGAHWPLDILGGILFGALIGWLVDGYINKIRAKEEVVKNIEVS